MFPSSYVRATRADGSSRMMDKLRDEHDALMICREKAAQRGMPMQIVDAEYQW